MHKAINFDLDTKKYEIITQKSAPTAYYELRQYLENIGFTHRQGSGYISNKNMTDGQISLIISEMASQIKWLKYCVKQFDVTNIGTHHSMLKIIEKSDAQMKKYDDIQKYNTITPNNNIEDDYELEI